MQTTRPRPRPIQPLPAARDDLVFDPVPRKTKSHAASLPERGVLYLCPHPPDHPLTARMVKQCNALIERAPIIHFCCTTRPDNLNASVIVHEIGENKADSPIDAAAAYGHGVARMLDEAGPPAYRVVAFGSEWSSIPALEQVRQRDSASGVLMLDSLERQRSDLSTELSRRIETIERQGLQQADRVVVASHGVAQAANALEPGCAGKLRYARHAFPVEAFASKLDPGEVKARYQVGPVDPVVLFVGDMTWATGPDIVTRAMPALLRNHGGIRAIFVGEGDMTWPVRVQARYMLIEHAVRILGHRDGQEVHELVAASDIIVVPSRDRTPDWPILAAWAAGRPVVATHQASCGLCAHERDAVLVYPNPGSCVWGVERVLYDPGLVQGLRKTGRETLEERFGWGPVAAHIRGLIDEIEDERRTSAPAPAMTTAPMVEARP